ncbi:hypothetical protein AGJ34_21885 [Cronobacter dublinensis subsp. dublinensis]|nr:hypothetical protein [Cronobacter dublinensis subsp. dublinensis]EGT5729929.1 hypothetical protein [Cronobacter dublinensis subsp. dublinensis]
MLIVSVLLMKTVSELQPCVPRHGQKILYQNPLKPHYQRFMFLHYPLHLSKRVRPILRRRILCICLMRKRKAKNPTAISASAVHFIKTLMLPNLRLYAGPTWYPVIERFRCGYTQLAVKRDGISQATVLIFNAVQMLWSLWQNSTENR